MSVRTQTQPEASPRPLPKRRAANPWLARITLIITSIFILSNLIAALLLAGYQIYYDGLIYPGVHVWDVDLSGMTPQEAAVALNGKFTYPQMTTITFRDEDTVWPASAAELGIRFDVEKTVQAAYEVGRQPRLFPAIRQQVTAWRQGIVISPVLIYDQAAADQRLSLIAAQINRPVLDATLTLNGIEVVTTPGQVGRQVDQALTLSNLNLIITRMENAEVPVVVVETQPLIMDATDAAAIAETILAADLEIVVPNAAPDDPGPWAASRESLANMLIIERAANESGEGQHYTVRLNEAEITTWLKDIEPSLTREAVNARFDFDEKAMSLTAMSPSVTGRNLNIPATVQMIQQQAPTADHRVPLVFEMIEPLAPDTATAEQLGIIQMISSATTYYYGSSEARKANIVTAASKINGAMIAPGELVSFNKYLGSVDADTGFTEGMIIYNGRTIKGIGGGVCQVSTTVFQAAFYAGFPIPTRSHHGYWVGYYNSGEGKGMDATVYEPIVDLEFHNDTPYWMLIKTYVDLPNSTMTVKFFSTSDGRTVQKEGPFESNVVPHGPALYEENPALAPGQTKQVDYAVNGFDVVVRRIVYKDGRVLFTDEFISHYLPWQAVFQVAPGYVPAGAGTVDGY